MSRIRSENTKPEMLIRRFLFSQGLRYKIHDHSLPGKPDLVFPKFKTVVFINGCFWHGHDGCKYFVLPKTRSEWWATKISKTTAKDAKNAKILIERGWKVLVVWECELNSALRDTTLKSLLEKIKTVNEF
ncbi:very short patch repair endonuclease [Dyadobacter chenwenxiniae]|uniref:Very short patch repair endonuclease n=1 Tax=Dyadobacter chenwenxiniae TaxID=2906456 RepID=A0A9X1PID4_9BACT|nr:very short patch repair endonuclease [Dyadobacter chenwenxiniae]UON81195.1 very short patch repair endonuclease [Dyadobacter chenwenxiniae]